MDEIMPSQIAIFSPVLVGLTATIGTIVIHGFVVHAIVMNVRGNLQRGVLGMRIWVNLTFVMAATLLAPGISVRSRFGRLRSISLTRSLISARPSIHRLAATRLRAPTSYCRRKWKLLGPFEAVDGMLLFGVSTAFIFAVINRLIHARFDDADRFLL